MRNLASWTNECQSGICLQTLKRSSDDFLLGKEGRFGGIKVKDEIDPFIIKKTVDTEGALCYKQDSLDGAVAQLGERLNGIQEVRGSIPRGSTN